MAVRKKKTVKVKAKGKSKITKPSRAKKPAKKIKSTKPVKSVAKKIAAKVVKSVKPATKAPAGIPEKLRNAALDVLSDRQAESVVTVSLVGKSALADYLILASGRSSRQVAAMAEYLRDRLGQEGARQVRVEGLPQADWVLVDAGDVIIHLFRPEVRRYYNIERIYGVAAPAAD